MSGEAELLLHTWVVQRVSNLNNFQFSKIREYEKSLSETVRSWKIVIPSVHLRVTGNATTTRYRTNFISGVQKSQTRSMSITLYSEDKLVFNVILFPQLGILLSKGRKASLEFLFQWLHSNFDANLASAVLPSFKLEQMLIQLMEVKRRLATILMRSDSRSIKIKATLGASLQIP
jgi:hypothetical protein